MTVADPYERHDPSNLPREIRRQLFISYGIGKYTDGEIHVDEVDLTSGRDTDWARVLIHKTEVTLQLPEAVVNVKEKKLEVLTAKKQEVLAENHRRLKEVQDAIDSLLALEAPKPAPVDPADEIPF